MKIVPIGRALIGCLCAALLVTQLTAAESPREHLSLDAGWKFHLGDNWPDALHLENAGTGSGPGLFDILEVLGKEEVLKRIDAAIERLQ